MNTTLHPSKHHHFGASILLLAVCASADANTADLERQELALALRQLDAVERQIRTNANAHPREQSRYRFDYPRLLDDLARVKAGIKDYLAPLRAQPRDPVNLSGDYLTESELVP